MSKKNAPFVPPLPHIDPPRQETLEHLRNLTKKDRKQLRKSIDKDVQKLLEPKKKQKQKLRREWWKNNWISLLSLVFAIIAALPVIIQAIDAMLNLLGQ